MISNLNSRSKIVSRNDIWNQRWVLVLKFLKIIAYFNAMMISKAFFFLHYFKEVTINRRMASCMSHRNNVVIK